MQYAATVTIVFKIVDIGEPIEWGGNTSHCFNY